MHFFLVNWVIKTTNFLMFFPFISLFQSNYSLIVRHFHRIYGIYLYINITIDSYLSKHTITEYLFDSISFSQIISLISISLFLSFHYIWHDFTIALKWCQTRVKSIIYFCNSFGELINCCTVSGGLRKQMQVFSQKNQSISTLCMSFLFCLISRMALNLLEKWDLFSIEYWLTVFRKIC